jgi:hypothetical protein
MLRRSGLTNVEQRLVLSAAGAKWDLAAIEGALRLMFNDAHHDDRKRSPKGAGKASPHARLPNYHFNKGKGKGKGKFGKGTYANETPDDEWPEDDGWEDEWFDRYERNLDDTAPCTAEKFLMKKMMAPGGTTTPTTARSRRMRKRWTSCGDLLPRPDGQEAFDGQQGQRQRQDQVSPRQEDWPVPRLPSLWALER